jgi:hypothetical protein
LQQVQPELLLVVQAAALVLRLRLPVAAELLALLPLLTLPWPNTVEVVAAGIPPHRATVLVALHFLVVLEAA